MTSPAAGTFRLVPTIRRSAAAMLAAGAACALAGCGGGGDDYANKPRPATPINVTAAISDKKISISPKQFGGGPVVFIISNQTTKEQTLTLETDELGGAQGGIKQSTDPIAPRGTGTLKADMRKGSYAVSVRNGPSPASLEVGPPRKSAQDTRLEP
jgi:hypothetical protein